MISSVTMLMVRPFRKGTFFQNSPSASFMLCVYNKLSTVVKLEHYGVVSGYFIEKKI